MLALPVQGDPDDVYIAVALARITTEHCPNVFRTNSAFDAAMAGLDLKKLQEFLEIGREKIAGAAGCGTVCTGQFASNASCRLLTRK